MQRTHTFNVYVPFIFLIALFLLTVVLCWRASIELLLNFTNDDAFFYLKTAANFATGLGSTFDGINPTNGYHPLWFLLLAGVYFFLNAFHPVSPEFFFRINFIAAFCMCLCASALVVQALRPIARVNNPQKFLLFFLFLIFICIRDVGLETHITVLLLAAYVYLVALEESRATSNMGTRAFVLAALFLARTDLLFTVIPLLIVLDFCLPTRCTFQKKIISYGFFALVVLSYYMLNFVLYGHLTSISGSLKNIFPEIRLVQNLTLFAENKIILARFLLPCIALGVFAVFLKTRTRSVSSNRRLDFTLLAMLVGGIAFCFLHLCFNADGIKGWYTGVPVFASLIIFTRMGLEPGVKNAWFTVFIVLYAAGYAYIDISRMTSTMLVPAYRYALDLNKITSPEARIFQIDISGVVGYFSERSVVNGDGLINSFEFAESLRNRTLENFLREKNISYYSTYTASAGVDGHGAPYYSDDRFYDYGGYLFSFPGDALIAGIPLHGTIPFLLFAFPWADINGYTPG